MRTDADRGRLLQRITIAWNLGEVFVTVGLGLAAGSLALIAFGGPVIAVLLRGWFTKGAHFERGEGKA